MLVPSKLNKRSKNEIEMPKRGAAPAPTRRDKLEAELKSLKIDAGYTDTGRANHKQILARVQEIYRELNPEAQR